MRAYSSVTANALFRINGNDGPERRISVGAQLKPRHRMTFSPLLRPGSGSCHKVPHFNGRALNPAAKPSANSLACSP